MWGDALGGAAHPSISLTQKWGAGNHHRLFAFYSKATFF